MYSQRDARLAELILKGSANWTEEDCAYIDQVWKKMKERARSQITNNRFFTLWDEVLQRMCHCYPDEYGNRPCDYGVLCDRCQEKNVEEEFKKEWEKG